jgi:predicted membrane-bound spermidine synthase
VIASSDTGRPRAGALPYAALLLASGFAALVYETLWVRQLGRVVGVEVHAVTIALSAYFAGLAFGSALIGRRIDRSDAPIRVYALLEAGVALTGVLATVALAHCAGLFATLSEATGPLAWLLPFVLVGAPAFLMGGTLPALLRALRPHEDGVPRATATLYAANTAGAVGGALATPFMLVPTFGIAGTGLAAGAIGLAVAALALVLSRLRERAPSASAHPGPSGGPPAAREARVALALYACAGGIALGYQVVWSELLVQFLSTRTYAFAVMLATYLGGLALGSALYVRVGLDRFDGWRVLGTLLVLAAASAIGGIALLGGWLPDAQAFAGMWAMRFSGDETVEVLARFAVASAALLLLPTTLLGAAFPAATRLYAHAARVGGDVGAVAAFNTAGGIVGTLATGFLLVPAVGLVRALAVLALLGALLGAFALTRSRKPATYATAAACVVAVAGLAIATPPDRLARLLAAERGGELLYYAEDVAGTVAVIEQVPPSGRGASFRRLYIQGVSNSGDALTSQRYMRLQALLPLVIHPGEPRSALVLGFGTGITAGALLAYPWLERRIVAELLPAVVDAGPLFAGNLGASRDPRLDIRIGDGRHTLLRDPTRYDLVTLEPPPPSATGVVNLYSREFYELCRARLAPGGLMAQWWPLPAQNDEDSRALVRTFLDVFPHASAWSTELHEMLLVGSLEPFTLDERRIAARFDALGVADALTEVGIASPAALLATWITDSNGLAHYADGAPSVTDDRPLIEHAAWVRREEISHVLPRILAVASDVPLPAHARLHADVSARREELHDFYRAALLVFAGRHDEAATQLRDVLARDPDNAYYRWVLFGAR